MSAKAVKGDLYVKELEGARLRGEWSSDAPSTGAAGKPLPWSELIRKYMKHNPDSTVTPSIANTEQQIRAALIAFWSEIGYSDASHDKDEAQPRSGHTAFPPELPQDQFGAGWSGKSILDGFSKLEELKSAARDDVTRFGIVALQAFVRFSMGQNEKAIELLHSSDFMQGVRDDQLVGGSDYNIALMLMGFTIYGQANERLHVARPTAGYSPFAFAGYARAIDLHETFRGGKRANSLRGLPDDEVERWGETALYRNALLSVREGDLMLGLNALRAYQAHAGRWPAKFRLPQRNAIYRTYLRELSTSVEVGGYLPPPATAAVKSQEDYRSAAFQRSVLDGVASRVQIRDFESERLPRHGQARRMLGVDAKGITSRTTSTRRPAPHRQLRPASATWSNELLTVQRAAATSIEGSSEFPKAGQINTQALQLADDLVRGWRLNGEQGGENADEVVEILYTLSRITFHSQRIARHLFTVLVAAEAYEEARKAAELYISIYEKAKSGSEAVAATMGGGQKQIEGGAKAGANGKHALDVDADDEATYVKTVVHAAHVLVRYLGDAEAADKLGRRALELSQGDDIANDRILLAAVKRCAGTTRAALSAQKPDPRQRETLHEEALTLLKQSATLDSQSSETLYQLAYLQAEMRDVTSAIRNARKALELEPADIETWHLLTLLISAQKDFRSALRIAEEALAEAEEDDEADLQAILRGSTPLTNGAAAAAAAASAPANGKRPVTHEARTALLSVDYPPTYAERAESTLRLMMTYNALSEIVHGSESAIEGQRELFEFFHRKVATTTLATSRGIKTGATAGGKGGVSKQGNGSHSTLLASSATIPHRFGSLSGLGQSGTGAQRHHLSLHRKRIISQAVGAVPSSGAAVASDSATGEDEAGESAATPIAQRAAARRKTEAKLLGSLWLMAAASFRRAGKHEESRVAIQEGERIDAGRSDVWVQLALWFEADDVQLAINSLYKALACQHDSIGAAVHLARLFIAHPALSPSSVQNIANDAPAPEPRTAETEELLPTPLARAIEASASRAISGGSQPDDHSPGGTKSPFNSAAEAQSSLEKQTRSALALAEGLLGTVTSGNGWDCPEAWLFLGRVAQATGRSEKSRECLKYALKLEETKPIRSLPLAVRRC